MPPDRSGPQDVGYWPRVTGLTTWAGHPDEDFDERDHRKLRCGADRPAIIQTGAEIVPPRITRGETNTSPGVVWPGHKIEALAWPRRTVTRPGA